MVEIIVWATVACDDHNLLHVHLLGISKLWRGGIQIARQSSGALFSVRRVDLCLPCHTPVLSVPLAIWIGLVIIDVLYRMYITVFSNHSFLCEWLKVSYIQALGYCRHVCADEGCPPYSGHWTRVRSSSLCLLHGRATRILSHWQTCKCQLAGRRHIWQRQSSTVFVKHICSYVCICGCLSMVYAFMVLLL